MYNEPEIDRASPPKNREYAPPLHFECTLIPRWCSFVSHEPLGKQCLPPSLTCRRCFHLSQTVVSGPTLGNRNCSVLLNASFAFYQVLVPVSLSQTPRAMSRWNHRHWDLLDLKMSSSNTSKCAWTLSSKYCFTLCLELFLLPAPFHHSGLSQKLPLLGKAYSDHSI